MIKLISENKWFVRIGSGDLTKDYIIDAADNSVSKSTLTESEISVLETCLPDGAMSGTVKNALILSDLRVSNQGELSVLAVHLDLINLLQYEG